MGFVDNGGGAVGEGGGVSFQYRRQTSTARVTLFINRRITYQKNFQVHTAALAVGGGDRLKETIIVETLPVYRWKKKVYCIIHNQSKRN